MELIKLFLILAVSLSLRAIFIMVPTSDMFLHMWHIEKSRRFGFGNHRAFKSLISGTQGYPSLPHYIVSRFPEKHQIKTAYSLNLIYDGISILCVYLISKLIFSNYGVFDSSLVLSPHLVVTLLYATTPILFPVTTRLKTFGGRTFGNLLATVYFSALGAGLLTGNLAYYVVCIGAGLLILLASQFGMQVMLFFSIVLSLLYLNPIPIVLVATVALIGITVPALGIRDFFKFKINHYRWYVKNSRGVEGATGRNRWIDFVQYPRVLISDPKRLLQLTFYKLTPVIAAYTVPTLTLLVYWGVVRRDAFGTLLADDVFRFVFLVALSSLIVFVLISTKWLYFLGQAERYFEYSAGAICIVFVAVCAALGQGAFWFYVFLFQVTVIIVNFVVSLRATFAASLKGNAGALFDDLTTFIDSQGASKILTIPLKLNFRIGTQTADDVRCYYQFITENKIDGFRRQQADEKVYNFVVPDLKYFNATYGIDTIVAAKDAIERAKDYDIHYDFSDLTLAFENDAYCVYRF